MGASYIPENKVFAVCTYQLNSEPQKFSHSRNNTNVFYQNKKQPLLTENDRNLMKEFTCKAPANLVGSFFAFGTGLVLFATGPIGWIVAGAIAVTAVAVTIAIITHKCTSPLSNGNWFLLHGSVKINNSVAITRSSILKCGNEGILTPFFDENVARNIASSIADKNRKELGLNIIASFGAGYFLPSSFQGWGAANIGGKVLLLGKGGMRFVFGYFSFSVLNNVEISAIRGYNENIGALKDNTTYDNMNNHVDDAGLLTFDVPKKPDDYTQDIKDLGKDNPIIETIKSRNTYLQSIELQQRVESLDGLSKPVLRNNPTAQSVLRDINKSSDLKSTMTHYNSRRMNPSMVDDARTSLAEITRKNLNEYAKNSIQGVLFFLPFIGTWFSEQARSQLAIGVAEDMSAEPQGISIIANTPID